MEDLSNSFKSFLFEMPWVYWPSPISAGPQTTFNLLGPLCPSDLGLNIISFIIYFLTTTCLYFIAAAKLKTTCVLLWYLINVCYFHGLWAMAELRQSLLLLTTASQIPSMLCTCLSKGSMSLCWWWMDDGLVLCEARGFTWETTIFDTAIILIKKLSLVV